MERGDVATERQPKGLNRTQSYRDSVINYRPVMIPRPQFTGMKFIPTTGRKGYYMSVRRKDSPFGPPAGPKRPSLADLHFGAPPCSQPSSDTIIEEERAVTPTRSTASSLSSSETIPDRDKSPSSVPNQDDTTLTRPDNRRYSVQNDQHL